MGKTAVFVLACLQQIEAKEQKVKVVVVCHTRELAYQIKHEFDRFAKYFQDVKTGVVFGGVPLATDRELMKNNCPHVLIATPGRLLALCREKTVSLDSVSHFVLDECDKCLDKLDMRKDPHRIHSGVIVVGQTRGLPQASLSLVFLSVCVCAACIQQRARLDIWSSCDVREPGPSLDSPPISLLRAFEIS